MSEAKHTPGPWRAIPRTGHVHAPASSVQVCEVGDYHDKGALRFNKERWDADKLLIAAAPELLEALQGIGALPNGYCFCPKGRDANKPEHEHTGECRAARAAIAKAQGVRS